MLTAAIRPESDTRARIIETAERSFREIGYQKTTVADIAKALKMSPANIYRFFESKKAINEAVAERLMGEVEAAMTAIAEGPGTAVERLRALIDTTHRMNAERYIGNRRMHEMVEVAMTESWEVVHGHIERTHRVVHRILCDGVASGEFTVADPWAAAYCVKAAMLRFFHPQLLAQCAGEPRPTLDEMADFVLAGLGHRGP